MLTTLLLITLEFFLSSIWSYAHASSNVNALNVPPSTDLLAQATPQGQEVRLLVSRTPERDDPQLLHDSTVSDDVYIFVDNDELVSKVNYFLDDPEKTRRPRHSERYAPFDFSGTTHHNAKPFDTNTLSNGQHQVTAVVWLRDNTTTVLNATFTVQNNQTRVLARQRSAGFGPVERPLLPQEYVTVSPGDNLQALIDANPEGTAFYLTKGTYRRLMIRAKPGNVFVGEFGAVLNGAMVLSSFEKEGDYWVSEGPPQSRPQLDKCLPSHPACQYPEQLFINDTLLELVTKKSRVAPGKWFFDRSNNLIYIADDPAEQLVELSFTPQAIIGHTDVVIRNLVIQKYSRSSNGKTVFLQEGMLVEHNDISYNADTGINMADNVVIRNNKLNYNGRIGITGSGFSNVLVEHNEIAYNNTKGFDYNWEAGASKFARTDGLIVRNNYVHDNFGHGIWTDIDNRNVVIENNLVADNLGNGIFHEISFNAVIKGNVVERSGINGIYVSNSSDTDVFENELRNNYSSLIARNACRDREHSLIQNVRFFDNDVFISSSLMNDNSIGTIAGLYVVKNCPEFKGMDWQDWYASMGNEFSNNTYHLPVASEDKAYFFWNDASLSLDSWRKTVND